MSFPRYPKYKQCKDHWIASIPDHWEFSRLKRACKVFPSNVDKKSYDDETSVVLCNYTDVYYNERITRDLDFMEATATNEQVAKFTLRAGDVIITKDSETADDIAVSAYVPEHLPGVVCGYHLSMIRPYPHVSGAFIKRLFDSAYTKGRLATLANGLTRVGLGQYQLDNLELPIPPLKEQEQIVDFLDRETAKIDSLIEEQQKLIELLKEKRQAVISHAVTKGLNPSAAMKPSGIEWIGDIPAHWELVPLKYLISLRSGGTPSKANINYWDGDIPWASSKDIKREELCDTEDHITSLAIEEKAADLIEPNSLLVVVRGMILSHSFPVAKAIVPMAINQDLKAIRPRMGLEVDYLAHLLRGFAAITVSLMDEAAHGTKVLRIDSWLSRPVPVPPRDEQLNTVKWLNSFLKNIDKLRHEAVAAIELLQERRTALISAAVTGKIDVRNLAHSEAS